jgi:hypothetical protein
LIHRPINPGARADYGYYEIEHWGGLLYGVSILFGDTARDTLVQEMGHSHNRDEEYSAGG